jgi:thymidylate synthase
MAGDRKAEYIQKYASLWSEIKTQDGLLNSNYGWLVFYNQNGNAMNPFKWAMHSLINDKDSRQALITFNTGQFNIVGTKDYICTQYMHFMIRNNQLICFVGLRSSDSIFGLPNNIPFWKFVQLQALIILKNKYPDLKIGFIKVNIDSSHIYGRHFVLVEKMLKSSPKTFNMKLTTEVPLNGNADFYYIRFDDFIKIKEN